MTQRKHIPAGWLMGLSMVLLTGFVVYWLIGQYNDQKDLLHKKMAHELFISQETVMDSVIMKKIRPIIMDSLKPSVHISKGSRVDIQADSGTAYTLDYEFRTKNLEDIEKSSVHVVDSDHSELFFKGVKLVMQITEDSVVGHDFSSGVYLAEEDSQQVLVSFTNRVKNFTGHDFTAVWHADSLSADVKKKGGQMFIALQDFPNEQFVQVDRVFPYILQKIIPQILFGILLLLLSGSAFIFTFRSLRKQIELNMLRSEFVSNISHELKTPVSTVKVALEALQNYERIGDPQTTREYLSMAQSELDRLEYLTQKVLTHSRLESGQLIDHLHRINLVEVANDVINRMRTRVNQTESQLHFETSLTDAPIKGDRVYLEGVLINLIDNAMKYAGPRAEITIQLRSVDDQIVLCVEDSGPGIPDAYKRKVFEQFFRIPANNKHNVKGHGLGLSFASLVMEQHGGSISVKDRQDGGACFELYFQELKDES